MAKTKRRALAAAREKTLAALERAVPEADVALIDHPSYQNVGDTMIWLGQRALLKSLQKRVRYSSNIANYDPSLLRTAHPDGPILLQGGGNFGDLWPEFQSFREKVAEDFPDRRIVQLPQSVYFQNATNAAKSNSRLSRHTDFLLLVRDLDSLERTKRDLPDLEVQLCPDMALGLIGRQVRPRAVLRRNRRIVVISRRDQESVKIGGLMAFVRPIGKAYKLVDTDWGLSGTRAVVWKLLQIPGKLVRNWPSRLPARWFAQKVYQLAQDAMSHLLLDYGVNLVSSARLLVTDRLHAHFLAAILEVPHVALDNTYGKIRAVSNFADEAALSRDLAYDSDGLLEMVRDRLANR